MSLLEGLEGLCYNKSNQKDCNMITWDRMNKRRLAGLMLFGLAVRDHYSLFCLGKQGLWTPIISLKAQTPGLPQTINSESIIWLEPNLTGEQSPQMPSYKFMKTCAMKGEEPTGVLTGETSVGWTCPFLDTSKLSHKSQSCANKVSLIVLLSAIFVYLNKHMCWDTL